jgi:hypothetical protein
MHGYDRTWFVRDVTPRFPRPSVSISYFRGYDRARFMHGAGVIFLWLVREWLTCCCGYFGSPPYDGHAVSNTASAAADTDTDDVNTSCS